MRQAELLTPADLADLAAALSEMTPDSRLLAGGTDLANEMRRGECRPDLVVDLSGIRELTAVRGEDGVLRIGAMATFSRLQADPVVRERAECLAEAAACVGSVQVRNIATIGGNVANASPCADSIPALMALEAAVTVLGGAGSVSSMPVQEVVVGPHMTSLHPDEAIIGFSFKPLRDDERSAFAKIGSRSAVSVARLSLAVVVRVDPATGLLSEPRVALGAVGGTAFRDVAAEAALDGREAGEATARRFAEACAEAVGRSIAGRYSVPYKQRAALGLAYDAWNALGLCPPCEPAWD